MDRHRGSESLHHFVSRIYEAAVLPASWPALLHEIADAIGCRGAVLVWGGALGDPDWIASRGVERMMEDYAHAGWLADPSYAAPLFRDIHPGFSTLADHYTPDALEDVPAYAEFFKPRGLIGAAATIIQGPEHSAVQLSFEGFDSHASARAAVGTLDALRPHLARAMSLAARMRVREAEAVVEANEQVGIPSAIVGGDGRVVCTGRRFEERLLGAAAVMDGRLRFRDRAADRSYADALAARATGRSFVARSGSLETAIAVHMLPLTAKIDRALYGGVLLIVVSAANRAVPGADLLRLMFDLTPAEARMTRLLVERQSLAEAAAALDIRESTARAHLRAVFAKTGVSRQADLLAALSGLRVAT